MALDVWFREDVERILRATAVSGTMMGQLSGFLSMVTGEERRTLDAYHKGYLDALTAVALNFGLSPADLSCEKEA